MHRLPQVGISHRGREIKVTLNGSIRFEVDFLVVYPDPPESLSGLQKTGGQQPGPTTQP